MRLSIKEIFKSTHGSYVIEPASEDVVATGLVWDSREVSEGCIYLALPGERVDGRVFVAQAFGKGAVCALVMGDVDEAAMDAARDSGLAIISVANTYKAIEDLAAYWRGKLNGRVIGLSGSTGKTTTKNLVRDVLSAHGSVVATQGNQNNEIGVPKTLLSAEPDTTSVVVEMGMRGLHQLDALCSFVKPSWGLLTNVGESHIELLGSRENIARAKSELFASLPDNTGVAFLNIADDFARFVCDCAHLSDRNVGLVCYDGSLQASERVESFSYDDRNLPMVWASDIKLDPQGCASFNLCARGFGQLGLAGEPGLEIVPCTLALRGVHNVSNACAAAAVGYASGMSLADCALALGQVRPEPGRQDILSSNEHVLEVPSDYGKEKVAELRLTVPAGITVVDDSYNANPDSMRASLSTFSAMAVSGKRIAVLGDMGELGSFAPECHARVGSYAAHCSLDLLVCVGDLSVDIVAGAKAAGMPADKIVHVDDIEAALAYVAPRANPGDAVLVKASNFMEFSRIVKGLVG